MTWLPLSALNLKEVSESEIVSSWFLPHRPTLASSIPAFPITLLVRVHKGLIAYSLKMAHCGDLTNKGWSHSGHIALVDILFFP